MPQDNSHLIPNAQTRGYHILFLKCQLHKKSQKCAFFLRHLKKMPVFLHTLCGLCGELPCISNYQGLHFRKL